MKLTLTKLAIAMALAGTPLTADNLPQNPEWEILSEEEDTFAGTVKYIFLGVEAETITPDLRWASLQIDCEIGTTDPPQISVDYVFKDDEMKLFIPSRAQEGPLATYGESYSFDLMDSGGSNRPAAYNLGSGFVRNDDYDAGSPFSKRSNEYFARMVMFLEQILVMEDSDSIEVRFISTGRHSERMLGNYFSMVFPMQGFSAVSSDLKDCINQG